MEQLKMGFGQADFSPDGSISMNSTITGHYVYDPLYANCLAWQQGDLTVLQFDLDLRNIYDPFYNFIHTKISEDLNLPKDRILISVTHNHSSPDIALLNRPDMKDWLDRIGAEAVVEAGRRALADLTPVTGAVAGKADTYRCSFVRRYFREDGTFDSITTGKKSESPLARHESEADPELRVVRFFREGNKDVILVNFQTHAASALGQYKDRICSDFVGPLRNVLQAEGDAVAMYLQGACGNTNIVTRLEWEKEGWPKEYEKTGIAIAETAKVALKNAKPLALGELKLMWNPLTCTVNHERTYLADAARAINAEPDQEKKMQMIEEAGITSRYEVGAILKRAAFGTTREMPLASLLCGEFGQGFAPVELFDTCGKAFREASPCEMTFFCGYANGSHSYMPSATAYPNGGYEALQCFYVPGTGEMIALELARQLQILKKN